MVQIPIKAMMFDRLDVKICSETLDLSMVWVRQGNNRARLREGKVAVPKFFYGQMNRFLNPVICDIGSGVGLYTLLAKFHACQMYAFEPNPLARSILERNIALNKLRNVRIFDFALFHEANQKKLKIPKECVESGLATLGSPRRFSGGTEVEVETKRLDACGLGWVDLIKVDTEGAELYVLQGAKALLQKCHPSILMENNKYNTAQFGYRPDKIIDFLKTLGYKHFQHVTREDVWVEYR